MKMENENDKTAICKKSIGLIITRLNDMLTITYHSSSNTVYSMNTEAGNFHISTNFLGLRSHTHLNHADKLVTNRVFNIQSIHHLRISRYYRFLTTIRDRQHKSIVSGIKSLSKRPDNLRVHIIDIHVAAVSEDSSNVVDLLSLLVFSVSNLHIIFSNTLFGKINIT